MTPIVAPFPAARLRRTRMSAPLRAMVQETALTPGDLIWPVFVRSGSGIEEPVASMPGVMRRSVDKLADVARHAASLGIPAICIFPYSSEDDRSEDCAEAWNPDNLSNRATREIKNTVPDIAVMTDVALDPYSNTGHDGFVEDGEILKATYQMNPANSDEAMRLIQRDLQEGADMVMVKPGMPYLDICRRVKDQFGVPTFAYQVSGEYAMIQAAAQNGWLDGDKVMMESLMCFKRAGCDGVLSYFAPRVAEILANS